MKLRGFIALTAGIVLLLPVAAGAQSGKPTYQVSGGGQTVVSTMTGPGSTIAFVAQGFGASGADTARGQLQVNDRLGSEGKFHGVVDCIIPDFDFDAGEDDTVRGARFGGYDRDTEERFLIDVVDKGQPTPGSDLDLANFRKGEFPADCPDENDDDHNDAPEMTLGRGNVKVHDRR